MTGLLRRCAVCAAMAGLLVVVGGLSLAQDPDAQTKDATGKKKAEVASGVIVRVEDIGREKTKEKDSDPASDDPAKEGRRQRGHVRVTINTAAIWSDFVRDQATTPEKAQASTATAATKGADSIATKGEPKSSSTLVTVEVGPQTRIVERFRSSTDETSLGATTAEGAAKAETAPDESDAKIKRRERREAKTAEAVVLKPGLFVQAEFRDGPERNRAIRVTVLRPVGGPDTSAKEAAPKEPAKTDQ